MEKPRVTETHILYLDDEQDSLDKWFKFRS